MLNDYFDGINMPHTGWPPQPPTYYIPSTWATTTTEKPAETLEEYHVRKLTAAKKALEDAVNGAVDDGLDLSVRTIWTEGVGASHVSISIVIAETIKRRTI